MPAGRIKDRWREKALFVQRSLVCAAIMGFGVLGLIVRLFVLQVARHEYYSDLSQGNRVRNEPIPAARGLILDRNGEVIAGNQPAYQLEMVPEEVADLEDTLARLVRLELVRSEDVGELERTVESSRSFDSVPIRLRMSDEDVARFAVRRFEFQGLDIKTRQTRWYPNGELAVHALGYVGAISEQDLKHIDRAAYAGTALIGKLGVESAFERELHGTNGYREVLVNALGRSVERQGAFVPNLRTRSPAAGDDLLLAIDLKVQRTAEAALAGDRARRAHLPRGGSPGSPLLRRRLPSAAQRTRVPRVPQRAPRVRRPGRRHRALLRRLLLRPRRCPRRGPDLRVHGAVRLRQGGRHRYRRREARDPSLARVEGEGVLAARGSGVVSGRDGELRHRPGLSQRDAAAARPLREHH